MNLQEMIMGSPVLRKVAQGEEVLWINPRRLDDPDLNVAGLSPAGIDEAEARLQRFAPYLNKVFPETAPNGGLIESPLQEIPAMQALLSQSLPEGIPGRLLLKLDSHLPIAGSVKARGGIYEILKHSEDLVLAAGLLSPTDSYEKLAGEEFREFFQQYAVQVGSTGNLGLSIGIMSAKLGYRVTVHMSADARQWKKDLLRSQGVTVMEYAGDYSKAVAQGRALSEGDPKSYFVDDENSRTLFYGYAVAARRLQQQLAEQGIRISATQPLFVYIPCGVGGAPGGIAYGLRSVYGGNAHIFFVEPTQAPCMLAGMASGLNHGISVQDIALSGQTEADGLAVGRPSGFVGEVMQEMLSGIFTLRDYKLFEYLRALDQSEGLFIEPSACAAFEGPASLLNTAEGREYIRSHGLEKSLADSIHIPWATGGSLVPQDVREDYIKTWLENGDLFP